MKKVLPLFLLLTAVAGSSFLCGFSYGAWKAAIFICSLVALFIIGTLAFFYLFLSKNFSLKNSLLFSFLGGGGFIGLHFLLSYIINSATINNARPYVTALITCGFTTLFFLILSFLTLHPILEELKNSCVYQEPIPPSDKESAPANHITNRLYSSRWGVFIHYLSDVQNNPEHPSNMGVGTTDWSACVDELDVHLLAKQLHESGAHFLYITIMQGSRHMIAPNKTYDDITGMRPGEACAERDLVLDLYDALEPYGIDLYLYTTGDGPHSDPVCGRKMGFVKGRVSKTFVKKWASVMKEYALRYGTKVKGWWFDGCYRSRFGYTDKLMEIYYKAVKAGNPNAVVAFNNGVMNYYKKNYRNEDYVCGEFNFFNVIPRSRFIDGAQVFLLAPLGQGDEKNMGLDWARPGARYTGQYMRDFVSCCNKMGGVVAIDIGMKRDGSLYPEQLSVLKEIEP